MYQGFYTIASGVLMEERAINVLSNNMVNANTPGFKASRLVGTTFEKELLRVERGTDTVIGTATPISIVSEAPTRFDDDSLIETGRPMDIAINGEGFFQISAPAAEEGGEGTVYLTRNGNFELDEEGYLILAGAGRVMGQSGEVQLAGSDFSVDEAGRIYQGGRYIDTLLITVPAQDQQIERVGNALFQIEGGQEGITATAYTTVQNWLERANIDLNREYTMVIEAQRAFQSCSTALQIVDKLNQKAATQIASL